MKITDEFKLEFKELDRNIRRLRNAENRLNQLDTGDLGKVFVSEIDWIRANMRIPSKVDEVERALGTLEGKIGQYSVEVELKVPTQFPQELLTLYSSPEPLGSGGFARVFRAVRKSDGKTVAVKLPLYPDEATGKSFLTEIKTWEDLKHPYIVELYDVNIFPVPYLEMEYMEGGSLEKVQKPLPVEQATQLVLQLAEALEYAHGKGVTHRDIKPGNVLLSSDFIPKVGDWGLAKIKGQSRTTAGSFFSPLYAAPEQISRSKFGRSDERTDIYQLGAVFYELLTGRTSFTGDDLTSLGMAIMMEEAEPVSTLNREAATLEGIVKKCMAKRKDDRYQDVSDLLMAMRVHLKETCRVALKHSVGNLKRSAFYCCELFLLNVKLNDVKEALKYCGDLKKYARGDAIDEVEKLTSEIENRLKEEVPFGEEFVGRAELITHQIHMMSLS